MSSLLTENQLAEVSIIGEQNTLLTDSQCQHRMIFQSVRRVIANSGHIIASLLQEGIQTILHTFIKQKFHTWAWWCSCGFCSRGYTSSPSTSACAYARQALTSSWVSRG